MSQIANQTTRLKMSVVLLAALCTSAAGKTIYVDDDAEGLNDGSSWVNAYQYLQDALADANSAEKPVEIRIAQGLYTPDSDSAVPDGTGDRAATFRLINGVTLKGGYAGCGAPQPNTRDIDLYEAVLSGKIRTTGFGGGNSYHVVTGSGTDETAVLDGLAIIDGNADGPRLGEKPDYDYRLRHGAGIYNDSGSPTLTRCAFRSNSAYSCGGGMYNANSNPSLAHCTFDWNSADDGGGMYNDQSSPTLIACAFSLSRAIDEGGGIYSSDDSRPTLTDCIFSGNWADDGGGMYNLQSDPVLTDCTFSANSALFAGGIDDSYAAGGGMYNQRSSPTLTNCLFSENTARAAWGSRGGGMYNDDHSRPTLTDCIFSENWAEGYGGGLYNSNSDPTLANCAFYANWTEAHGGGMYNQQSDPMITNCVFSGNWVVLITGIYDSYIAGGGMYNEHSSPTLARCVFSGNLAEHYAGGMYDSNSSTSLANCIFSGNWAADCGGAIYSSSSRPTLAYGTFLGNLAGNGSALACDSAQQEYPSRVELIGCILWDGPDQVWNNDNSVVAISYSNIHGGFPGEGNIDVDPLFAHAGYWADVGDPSIVVEPSDPNAVWADGDYHLKSEAGRWDAESRTWVLDEVTSPCIDAGGPNSNWTAELWPHGKRVNTGAFGGTSEASMSLSVVGNPADLNCDDAVGREDLLILAEMWLSADVLLAEDINRDGLVNFPDFAVLADAWLWEP